MRPFSVCRQSKCNGWILKRMGKWVKAYVHTTKTLSKGTRRQIRWRRSLLRILMDRTKVQRCRLPIERREASTACSTWPSLPPSQMVSRTSRLLDLSTTSWLPKPGSKARRNCRREKLRSRRASPILKPLNNNKKEWKRYGSAAEQNKKIHKTNENKAGTSTSEARLAARSKVRAKYAKWKSVKVERVKWCKSFLTSRVCKAKKLWLIRHFKLRIHQPETIRCDIFLKETSSCRQIVNKWEIQNIPALIIGAWKRRKLSQARAKPKSKKEMSIAKT